MPSCRWKPPTRSTACRWSSEQAGLGDYIVERLHLDASQSDLDEWRSSCGSPAVKDEVVIGVVGKYVELQDAYISVREALHHAAGHTTASRSRFAGSTRSASRPGEDRTLLEGLHGIVVPGGFGYRGVEGKIRAARFAREHKVPYLGSVPGHAGDVHRVCALRARLEEPNSTEFEPSFTRYPVIDLLPEQRTSRRRAARCGWASTRASS